MEKPGYRIDIGRHGGELVIGKVYKDFIDFM